MRQLGACNTIVHCFPGTEYDGRYVDVSYNLCALGDDLYLEIQMFCQQRSILETMVKLDKGVRAVQAHLHAASSRPRALPPTLTPAPSGDFAEYVLSELKALKKEAGIWRPKFDPGDVVIVDKKGADSVRVVDIDSQTSERVGKHAIEVKDESCTCPMRWLIMRGCPRLRGGGKCATESEAAL